jgi:hypothetical protein
MEWEGKRCRGNQKEEGERRGGKRKRKEDGGRMTRKEKK